MSIGSFKTKAEAEVAFAAAVSAQQRSGWIAPEKGRVTLEDYARQWLDTRLTSRGERLRPKTRELYEGFLRLHILPTLGPVGLGRLTTAGIRSWHADLLADGPGASSAAKCYRLLRTILSTAVEDGLIAVNPCSIKGAGVEPSDERRCRRSSRCTNSPRPYSRSSECSYCSPPSAAYAEASSWP